MSKRPSWWPPNPGPLSDPTSTEFDKGCKAMAKAMVERLEAKHGRYKDDLVDMLELAWPEWEQLKREALAE